jgi:predicted transcriptional regulator
MELDNEEMKSTYKSRMLRLQILADEIKKNKKMPKDEALRFAMNRWMMSKYVVEKYLEDLITRGIVKVTKEGEIEYVEYTNQEEV